MSGPASGPALLSALHALASGRRDLPLAGFSAGQIEWAIGNGLGPLLYHVTAGDAERERSPSWPSLLSADLTARVVTDEQTEAMCEILDRCHGRFPLVLLKGIAIAHQLYPEAHLRPMADIDLLVETEDVPAAEAALLDLGYERPRAAGDAQPEGHHHGVPFWHPGTANWVEVHWGLVPPQGRLGREPAFQPELVLAESRPMLFEGRPARTLGAELQLVYLTAHWSRGIPSPGGMVALADVALLLAGPRPLDWDRVCDALVGPASAVYLYLMLTYLQGRGLADPPDRPMARLRRRQRAFGRLNLALLHRLVDRCVVSEAGFGAPLTEPVFRTLWEELSRPAPPWANLARLAPYALPRRTG